MLSIGGKMVATWSSQWQASLGAIEQVLAVVLYPNNLGQLLWELHGLLVAVPVR